MLPIAACNLNVWAAGKKGDCLYIPEPTGRMAHLALHKWCRAASRQYCVGVWLCACSKQALMASKDADGHAWCFVRCQQQVRPMNHVLLAPWLALFCTSNSVYRQNAQCNLSAGACRQVRSDSMRLESMHGPGFLIVPWLRSYRVGSGPISLEPELM